MHQRCPEEPGGARRRPEAPGGARRFWRTVGGGLARRRPENFFEMVGVLLEGAWRHPEIFLNSWNSVTTPGQFFDTFSLMAETVLSTRE